MKFRAILELSRKTATGVEVPKEIIDSLGLGKKPRRKIDKAILLLQEGRLKVAERDFTL